jgi:ankyrin repeat protein
MPEITPIPPTRHSDPNSSRVEDFILQKLQKWTQAFLQLDPKDAGFGYVHGLQETPKALPAATLSKYYHFLDYLYLYVFERLFDILEMVYENPRLLMEVSPTNHCTFLHFAVVANAAELVQKLLELIQADKDIASSDEDPTSSINRKDHMFQNMRYLFTVESISGFTAHQMAYVAGNFRIISMIEKCQETMSGICGSIPTSLAASYGIGCRENPREQPEPYLRERIGEVLKSCLETVEFINVPLKIMSLGDEFRLHTSLLIFNGDAIHRWTNLYNDTSNDHSEPGSKLEELLQNTISKLAKESLLDAFLELRDDAGRNILHYLANLSSESFSGRDTFKKTCELIFQTLMNELVELAPTLDMNVTDNIGRTPLHLAAAQGFVKRVDGFVKHKPDMTAKYDMYSFGVDRDGEGDVFIRNITPLVLAATHNHFEVVRSLLNAARSQNIQLLNADCRIVKEIRVGQHPFEGSVQVQWSPFQLVAFKGHVQTLGVLLKVSQIIQPRLPNIITSLGHPINT